MAAAGAWAGVGAGAAGASRGSRQLGGCFGRRLFGFFGRVRAEPALAVPAAFLPLAFFFFFGFVFSAGAAGPASADDDRAVGASGRGSASADDDRPAGADDGRSPSVPRIQSHTPTGTSFRATA